ncbi:carbohydrate ABC transporter permease [Ammoniphilus sp. YIM 78166]|uniref:carbohydrate ABC transporter permease n=1 Tax=Ammoniphilus sp. YIM 78166 TaxID=1644106 RepID=UPI00106F9D80|nr:carbohydrate ABC transporter permease [Ammoniphilus sp. YIM 78166]
MEQIVEKEKQYLVVHQKESAIKPILFATLKYAFLIGFSVLTIFPILWVFSNSFRNNSQIFTKITLIPEAFDLTNYINVITKSNIPLSFWHSLSITVVSLCLLIAVVLPTAFAISRFKFKAAGYIYIFFSLAVFVPTITILPMLFKLYNQLGFLGQKYPIVFAYVVEQMPIAIFLMVTFMRAIPKELEEAAIIDGCSTWKIFLKIIIPLSQNAIVTVLILAFVSIWNDYIQAFIIIPDFRTLTVQLAYAKDEYTVDYGMMSASIMFAITPMIIFYLFIKERLIKGMAAGAVKG